MMTNAPLIWAYDVASVCGIAEGRAGEKPRLYSVRLNKEGDDHIDVYARTVGFIAERLSVEHPDYISIEAPVAGAPMQGRTNSNTTAILLPCFAIMAGVARRKGIRVRRAHIATVRKDFIGVGNLPGPEAKRRVQDMCKRLGWDAPGHDAADAAAVWFHEVKRVCPELAPDVTPLFAGKAS